MENTKNSAKNILITVIILLIHSIPFILLLYTLMSVLSISISLTIKNIFDIILKIFVNSIFGKKMKNVKSLIFLSLIALFSLGCGGGGSDSSASTTQNETSLTGIVVDSQISGLRYVSTSKDKTKTKKALQTQKANLNTLRMERLSFRW